MADALSRDFDLNDEEIVSLVQKNFADQVSKSFRIVPLPKAVIMSLGVLLRLQPKMQQLPITPVPSAAAAGKDTWASSMQLGTSTTHTSKDWTAVNDSSCSPASQPLCEKGGQVPGPPNALWELALDGKQAQFVPPSTETQILKERRTLMMTCLSNLMKAMGMMMTRMRGGARGSINP